MHSVRFCTARGQQSAKADKGERQPYHSRLDKALEELGHDIIKEKQHTMCGRCGQTWDDRHRSEVLQMGTCPGPGKWGRIENCPDNPTIANRGSCILWKGHKLHKTHVVAWKRGLIMCIRCGSYAQGARVRYLIDECPRRANTAAKAAALKAFRKGNHPLGRKGIWPHDDNTRAPNRFYAL